MSIYQISKIQVRSGLQEDLPSALACGELGWATDERRLYIGNGEYTDGAPVLGNTEVLTTQWVTTGKLMDLAGSYTFKGDAAGYTVQTGASIAAKISRTLQNKIDEYVSVKDFGAVGDGVTDCTDAFNRAIVQVYKQTVVSTDTRVRRAIHVPAGTYLISGIVYLYPYVVLVGDGKNSTFITQSNASYAAFKTSSALSGTIAAGKIAVSDLTIVNTNDKDVVTMDSVTDVIFDRVGFVGTLPATPGLTSSSCVRVDAETATPGSTTLSSVITFNDCDFIGKNYAFYCDNNIVGVDFIACRFDTLYRGLGLGILYTGTAAISAVRVSYSYFNAITKEAIYCSPGAAVAMVTSSFNYFSSTVGSPTTTPVIAFSGDNCYSIGDEFARSSTATVAALLITGKNCYAMGKDGKQFYGNLVTSSGNSVTLLDNKSTSTDSGLVIGSGLSSLILEYKIVRNGAQRVGTLLVACNGSTIVTTNTQAQTADVGVTLVPTISGTNINLYYTTTATTYAATLTVNSRTLV